jgi:hypothetical protein
MSEAQPTSVATNLRALVRAIQGNRGEVDEYVIVDDVLDQLPLLADRLDAERPMSWLSPNHQLLETCPGCGQKLSTVGLHKLAYVFDVCECGTPEYPHLVEQLWHRQHIGRTAEPIAATARREVLGEVIALLMKEARKPESAAPARQQITYSGGLRRAARLLEPLLGHAMDAESRTPRGGES